MIKISLNYCDVCKHENLEEASYCFKCGNLLKKKNNVRRIKEKIKHLDIDGFSFLSLLFDTHKFYVDENNFKNLFNILRYDPCVVLKMLEAATSAFYGHNQKKVKLSDILNILGTRRVSELVSVLFKSSAFKDIKKNDTFKQIGYHSLGVGIFGRLLAPHLNLDENEMSMACIMHDIGKIIMYLSIPEEYEMAVKITNINFIPVGEAEEDYIGIEHGAVGQMALTAWNYPKNCIDVAHYHHNMDVVRDPLLHKQLLCVQAANILCNLAKIGNMKSVRTMRFEILGKENKELLKGINIPQLMIQAKTEVDTLQKIFS